MNKNQKGFVLWFLVAAITAVIVIAGVYIVYRHHQSSTAQTAQNNTTSCNLGSCCASKPIPGVIEIHVAGNTDKQAVETLIKPIHGKLSIYYNTVETNSDYHEIDIPKGTETKAISYLKKQPLVIDAWQESNLCPN